MHLKNVFKCQKVLFTPFSTFSTTFFKSLEKNKFVDLKTIKGTQKLHSFIPISENQILARRFSFQEAYEELRLI